MSLHVVVLAGGSGTRLWPLSRGAVPKHLLPLAGGGRSLLRATLERVLPLGAPVHVVTVASQADACAAEARALGAAEVEVIAEPGARGTGPALGLAMEWIGAVDPDAVVCSVHADHHVADDAGYRRAVHQAAGWAVATGGLATVGVEPTYASTGFGYIEVGERRDPQAWRSPDGRDADPPLLTADAALRFVEKPPLEVAHEYVAGGRHLWNTGLFAWQVVTFLGELRAASAETADAVAAVATARRAGNEAEAARTYAGVPAAPVDTLVLERTPLLTAVRAGFGWSDLGSWADLAGAVRAAGGADAQGCVVEGDALVLGCRDTVVRAGGGRLVAAVGLDGVVVVDTPDALLVVPADQAQRVKEVVDRLRATGRAELL